MMLDLTFSELMSRIRSTTTTDVTKKNRVATKTHYFELSLRMYLDESNQPVTAAPTSVAAHVEGITI